VGCIGGDGLGWRQLSRCRCRQRAAQLSQGGMGGLGAKKADDAEHPADDDKQAEEKEDFHRCRGQPVGQRVKEFGGVSV